MANPKVHATIRPLGLKHTSASIMLTGAISKDGETEYLLAGSRVTAKELKVTGKVRQKEELIIFTAMNSVYNVSTSWVNKAEVTDFWKKHPLVQVSGEKRNPNAVFVLEVVAELQEKKKGKADEILKAMQTVYAMDLAQQKDVLYFFNRDPRDMDELDIVLYLCDTTSGVLITNDETRKTFLESFGTIGTEATDKTVEILTFIRKALFKGILVHKGGNVYFDGALLGRGDDAVIGYFIDNPEIYENLVKSLREEGDDAAKTVLGRPKGSGAKSDPKLAAKAAAKADADYGV
jgi:hypothetical protein